MLIAFGGLPGTGKTTLARALAKRYAAVYLRIDTIEQAIRSSGVMKADVGPAGYIAAYRLAEENLRIGRTVVADSVNPLHATRNAWLTVAQNASVPLIEVEVICSDLAEHRKRVESRKSDIDGLNPPSWKAVSERKYEIWPTPHIVIDTAYKPVGVAEDELIDRLTTAGYPPLAIPSASDSLTFMPSIDHPTDLTPTQIADLHQRAIAVAHHAYAPYSHFRVGAALLLDNGATVTGCNVENASYRLTTCAEQSAIAAAVSQHGPTIRIRAIAVANLNNTASQPCGACRQTINEFSTPTTVIFFPAEDGTITKATMAELLPAAFLLNK